MLAVFDFWDEMYIESGSICVDTNLILVGLTRFSKKGAEVVDKMTGNLLATLNTDKEYKNTRMNRGQLRTIAVRIGKRILVTVATSHYRPV